MRLRLTFSKTAAMRFTGHMDLHRTLERTFRRARLPLTHSQGFTPRPKMHIAVALPLGATGEAELADIWLDEAVSPEPLLARIRAASPPGIEVHTVEEVGDTVPKLPNLVRAAEYRVTLLEPLPDLDRKIGELLSAESIVRSRRKKSYDLRPLLLELERLPDEDGCGRIGMLLRSQEGATGRADEVVAALGGDPSAARVHRVRIVLEQDGV